MFLAEIGDIRGGGSKIRKPSRPSMATRAKSHGFVESRAAVSSALELQVSEPQGR
jgi:hypothetical protein